MKKKPRKSFKSMMSVTLILSSTLPMLVLGVFSIYSINRTAHNSVKQRLQETLSSVDTLINLNLDATLRDLDELGRHELIQNIVREDSMSAEDEKKLNNLFHNLMGAQSSYMNMYLISDGDLAFGTYDIPENYSLPLYQDWGVYREAATYGRNAVFMYPNYNEGPSRFSTSLSLVRKINIGDDRSAFVILDLSTEYVQSLLNTVKGTSFGYIQFIIASSNNDIIYNDSGFTSPIKLLNNVFGYDRFSPENSESLEDKLSEMMMETLTNSKYKLTYYGFIPNSMLVDQGRNLQVIIGLMILGVALVSSLLGIYSGAQISEPVTRLARWMKHYEEGDEPLDDMKNYSEEVSEMYIQFTQLMGRLDEYHKEDIEKQSLLRQSEIKSLMSQMNPHFLHNTLDSIKWKAKLNETEDIAFMVSELAFLLKASMNTTTMVVGVREELEFVESFINIIRLRYGDHVQYVSHINEDVYEYQIPKLLLQPLVENALIHGVEPLETPGIVEIRAWTDSDYLYFSVGDNGIGSDQSFEEILSKESDSIGLKNVARRMSLYYGHEHSLIWNSVKGQGTIVFIKIPKKVEVV